MLEGARKQDILVTPLSTCHSMIRIESPSKNVTL